MNTHTVRDSDYRYTKAEVDEAVAEALRRVRMQAVAHVGHLATDACVVHAAERVARDLGITL